MGVVLHPATGSSSGAGDFAGVLFVGIIVAERIVGHTAVRGGALGNHVAVVGELFGTAFLIGDGGDMVGGIVVVAGGVAAHIGDLGQAVIAIVLVFDTALRQVQGIARHGIVADLGEQTAGVVQGQQYAAMGIDHAVNHAAGIAGQPDGIVVLVAVGHDLALGVVVDP